MCFFFCHRAVSLARSLPGAMNLLTNVVDTSLVREDGRKRAGGDAVTVGRRSRRSPCASDRRLTAGRDGVAGWVLDSEVLAAVAAMRGEHAGCGRAYHDFSINRRGMFTKFLDAASREPQRVLCGSSWARATGAC